MLKRIILLSTVLETKRSNVRKLIQEILEEFYHFKNCIPSFGVARIGRIAKESQNDKKRRLEWFDSHW